MQGVYSLSVSYATSSNSIISFEKQFRRNIKSIMVHWCITSGAHVVPVGACAESWLFFRRMFVGTWGLGLRPNSIHASPLRYG
jgi:hypothetical protein